MINKTNEIKLQVTKCFEICRIIFLYVYIKKICIFNTNYLLYVFFDITDCATRIQCLPACQGHDKGASCLDGSCFCHNRDMQ